jgi:V/A-type H+-transporting ATPase subunit E
MKGLETGKDKIQKICDLLRNETLEPAKQEACEIIENARLQASDILKEAQKKADEILLSAKNEVDAREKVFQSSLQLSCRQGIEKLKQMIEEKLFNQQLSSLVLREMTDPHLIANLIKTFMKSMENKGFEEEFTAVIPKNIPPRLINELLGSEILERLQNETVLVGDFIGGIQIQMKEKQITIDISDATVRELIALYIRRDFREMIFTV